MIKHDDAYNTSRIPSWTDRILYYSKIDEALIQYSYDANNYLKISDHRPVFSQFEFQYEFSDGFATLRKDNATTNMLRNGSTNKIDSETIKSGHSNLL